MKIFFALLLIALSVTVGVVSNILLRTWTASKQWREMEEERDELMRELAQLSAVNRDLALSVQKFEMSR